MGEQVARPTRRRDRGKDVRRSALEKFAKLRQEVGWLIYRGGAYPFLGFVPRVSITEQLLTTVTRLTHWQGVSKYDLINEEFDDVYDEVDEATYNAMRRQRLADEDFIEHDEGEDDGYR